MSKSTEPLPKDLFNVVHCIHGSLKNFLYHLRICSGYLKASPGCREHSAHQIKVIRYVEKNGVVKKASVWNFVKSS